MTTRVVYYVIVFYNCTESDILFSFTYPNEFEINYVEKIEDRLFLTTEGGIEIPVPKSKLSSVEIGQKIAFGFRAEDIVPVKFGNKPQQFWDMKSKVNLAEPLGTETLIFTNLGNIEIVSRMFTPELVKAGDILDFSLNLDRTYLFDNSTGKAI